MDYELISDEDYADLPDDPEGQFIALEAICRRSISKLINNESSNHYDAMVRLQYMSTVSAAAEELGLSGLYQFTGRNSPVEAFDDFLLSANALATKIRLRKVASNNSTSVRLSDKTRIRIELQIDQLRHLVRESDLSEDRKASMLQKLAELSSEMAKPRASYAKILAILTAVSAAVVGTTGFLAGAPDAIATITSLIGIDKEAEEQEARRLGPPPKPRALPAPSPKPATSHGGSTPPQKPSDSYSHLDDDIPF